MTQLAEFGQDIEEVTKKLNGLISLLELTNGVLTESSDRLENTTDLLNQTGQSLATGFKQLVTSLTEMENILETETSTANEASETLQQSISEATNQLDAKIQAVEDAQTSFTTAATSDRIELEETITDLSENFTTVEQNLTTHEEEFTATQQTTEEVFNSLAEASNNIQEQTTTFQTATELVYTAFITELTDNLESTTETAFTTLSDQLTQEHLSAIQTSFSDADQELNDTFATFTSSSEEAGNQLQEGVSTILNQVGEDCQNSCREKLESAFQDAITGIAQSLADEVAENTLIMTTGTQITATMAPVLPAFAGVKVALEAANAVLDAVSIF